jgi:hypothetical protein
MSTIVNLNTIPVTHTSKATNGIPKPKKTKTSNKPLANTDNIESAIMTNGLNGVSVTNIIKTAKSNPKINELIEQMQQSTTPIVQNQQQQTNSHVTTDFDLKIDANTEKGPYNGKKSKKEIKSETVQVNEQNQESQPLAFITGSPAKLTAKRRRSSQKSNEALACSASNSKVSTLETIYPENTPVSELNPSVSTAAAAATATASSLNSKKASSTSTNRRKQLKTTLKSKESIDENELTTTTTTTTVTSSIHPNNLHVIEDHSSCSTSSQQDEEIKELLMQKTNFLNQQNNPNNNSTEISFDTQTQASSYSNSKNNNSNNKSLGINRQSVNTPTIHETEMIKKTNKSPTG